MDTQFGYAFRHRIIYNTKSQPGNLRLWASHNGLLGTDPIANGKDKFIEFLSLQFTKSSIFGSGSNVYLDISIGNDNDIFSLLVTTLVIKTKKEFSFKNHAGRTISFTYAKADNSKQDVIKVSVMHNDFVGIMTLDEVHNLESISRNILGELGYSHQEISEKVNNLK